MAPLHLLYISIPLVLTAVLYLIFRHRSAATKWTLVFLLTLINAAQHLLKPYIYPQYEGMSFGAMCTAYNMCALLILMSPIVMLVGSQLWRDFVLYIGAIAGIGSILTTYWLAAPMEEQIRFVICHGLLFVSSLLPALLGVYHANWRKFLKLPFVFFACLLCQIRESFILVVVVCECVQCLIDHLVIALDILVELLFVNTSSGYHCAKRHTVFLARFAALGVDNE